MPTVHSVRLGFATNSSSTHSLLLRRPGRRLSDSLVSRNEFGWDPFVASSRRSREAYVALHIKDALRNIVNEETALLVVKSLTGIDVSDGYVDHQSLYSLPMSRDGRGLDLKFLSEFRSFMTKEGLAILGGNDNEIDPNPHPPGRILSLGMPKDSSSSPYIARRDSRGYWTMFNVGTGAKVRFSWDGRDVKADKSDAPELVDLKITSFCPHGCPWCYQASDAGGRHAGKDDLDTILGSLSSMGVFEIAIGGGEPTCHPRFWEILGQIRTNHRMVPNFSTRSLDWLYVPEKAEVVREMCGGFAVSVTDASEIARAVTACVVNKMPLGKLSIQYVVGTGFQQAGSVMKECIDHRLRCTLLGYKPSGRGWNWKPRPDDWIESLKKMWDDDKWEALIGIDTVLAGASKKDLGKLGIARESYEIEDGRFSMYIDAVGRTMGPSSYGKVRVPLPDCKTSRNPWSDMKKSVLSAFAGW